VTGVAARFGIVAVALAIVAALSPAPDRVTDRDVYEKTEARTIVQDCSDLHCFRVLVPWVLGMLPGPSPIKWKAYSVVCNAAAAAGVFVWCLTVGFSRRAASFACVLTAAGFGGLYTLHDPYTSDPLMYALGPILTTALTTGRFVTAGVVASIGVLAKEFAAAPLYIFAGASTLGGRWRDALHAFIAGNFAFIVWVAFTLTLMLKFNYSYGYASVTFSKGAVIGLWLDRLSLRGVASAMFNEFGPLYLLAPAGIWFAPADLRRLAIAALPVAAVIAYVQQPDRALWNFHFLVVPFGALVLERAGDRLAAATLATFAIGNLKVGAQLPWIPAARVWLVASCVCASVAIALAMSRRAGEPRWSLVTP